MLDVQERVEGARVTTYIDTAQRLDTPQALTAAGTLGAVWAPDKGDVVIHRAELIRDGETVDLLKNDKFAVLRRELELEAREINGTLTATMAVGGARVGDVLRFSYSISETDGALKGEVQASQPLPAGTSGVVASRLKVTWPVARAIRVSAGPRTRLPAPVKAGGYQTLAVDLPLPKPPEMPTDAPPRYQLPPIFQLSSFASWEDVSRTLAALFVTTGTIDKAGPIAPEVAKIAAASATSGARCATTAR